MTVEATVLLVREEGVQNSLADELERLGLFVETTTPAELAATFPVVGADLVVHEGAFEAKRTSEFLLEAPGDRRVRLIVVVGRAHLAEMRKLDRRIVLSVLGNDMPQKILGDRIATLARKGPGETATSLAPSMTTPEKSPAPTAGKSPTRTNDEAAAALMRPSPRVTGVHVPKSDAPPALTAPALTAPAVSPSAVTPPLAPAAGPPRAMLSKAAAPPAPPAPLLVTPPVPVVTAPAAPIAPTASAPVLPGAPLVTPTDSVRAFVAGDDEGELPPLTVRRAPTADLPNDKLVWVDDDVTRADAIAGALRERGFQVLVMPGDPARTRWEVLRRFAPHLIVTNSTRAPASAWTDVLEADAHLRDAQRVSIAYGLLYDDALGTVRLEALVARIGRPTNRGPHTDLQDVTSAFGSRLPVKAPLAASASLPVSTPFSASTASLPPATNDADDEDRPTLVLDEDRPTTDWEDRPTLHRDVSQADIELSSLPGFELDAALRERPSTRLDTLQSDAPPDPDAPRPPQPLGAAGLEFPGFDPPRGRSSAPPSTQAGVVLPSLTLQPPASTSSSTHHRSRTPWLIGAGVLAASAVAGFWGSGALRSSSAQAESSANAAAPTPTAASPSAQEATTKSAPAPSASSAAAAAPSTALDLWRTAEDPSVPTCETLLTSTSDLRPGDVTQASSFWDKARTALVLGDSTTAQAHMCRAVFIHPPSLAAEGLAENLLLRRAPEQAHKWVQKGLEARPGRAKTLELLGDIESQRGHGAEAKDAWRRALGVPESDQKTLVLVAKQHVIDGLAALRAQNPTRAEILFRRAATLDANSPESAVGLARVFTSSGRKELGAAWLEEAFRRGPDSIDAWMARGDFAREAGDLAAAEKSYTRAAELNPNFWPAQDQLARLRTKKAP